MGDFDYMSRPQRLKQGDQKRTSSDPYSRVNNTHVNRSKTFQQTRRAHWNVRLYEESSHLTTFNTPLAGSAFLECHSACA